VAEAAAELAKDLGRKVTPQELAEETKMSLKAIQDAMRLSEYKIEDLEIGE
jgi:DNA-directed RNA polymerase specialized sigma subunit